MQGLCWCVQGLCEGVDLPTYPCVPLCLTPSCAPVLQGQMGMAALDPSSLQTPRSTIPGALTFGSPPLSHMRPSRLQRNSRSCMVPEEVSSESCLSMYDCVVCALGTLLKPPLFILAYLSM